MCTELRLIVHMSRDLNHVIIDFGCRKGMVGAGQGRVLEPGVGVPQAADRVPNGDTHAVR